MANAHLTARRTFKVTIPHMPHRFSNDLLVTIYPTGAIEIREPRRKEPPVLLELGQLYARARLANASPHGSR